MRIIDKNGIELENCDFTKGYLKEDIITEKHEAIEGVKEQFHYETVKEYPNGGKDVRKVIDIPGVEAVESWDEEIPVLRYIRYTEEELAEREANRKPTEDERISELEEAIELLLSGVTE